MYILDADELSQTFELSGRLSTTRWAGIFHAVCSSLAFADIIDKLKKAYNNGGEGGF